jgi:hypothetical protein
MPLRIIAGDDLGIAVEWAGVFARAWFYGAAEARVFASRVLQQNYPPPPNANRNPVFKIRIHSTPS